MAASSAGSGSTAQRIPEVENAKLLQILEIANMLEAAYQEDTKRQVLDGGPWSRASQTMSKASIPQGRCILHVARRIKLSQPQAERCRQQ